MLKRLFLLSVGLWSVPSFAGYSEITAGGNYRISKISSNNYQELLSYTGSYAFYFWELSALELSYTEGQQVVSIQAPTENQTITTTIFQLAGLDLILTLAGKDSMLQPYVKLGGAYVKKAIYREIKGGTSLGRNLMGTSEGVVPSAGVGFKIRMTQTFSIKVGVDAWTSPMRKNEPLTIDYAGRAGVSWMF